MPAGAQAEQEPAAAPLLALFCSLGLLSRAAALFDSLEVAALWDSLLEISRQFHSRGSHMTPKREPQTRTAHTTPCAPWHTT